MSDSNNSSTQSGEAQAADGAADESLTALKAEAAKLQEEAERAKKDYLYLRAEFDNYKKHAIKERSDLIKFGAERLARDLLGVLDNFERALAVKVTPETLPTLVKGVEMTAHELRTALQKHGIQEHPSEGVPFDPNHHEALSSEATTQVPDGHVLRVFQKAYKYHDKVIRPAHVVVAKKPEA